MDERELLAAFEDCSLPPALFTHREHVRIAWLCLRDSSLLEALPRFATALKRYATSLGAASKYHETITWAFLFVIHERLCRADASQSFDDFAAANADLLEWQSLLARFYRAETLQSDLARRVFVMPDQRA